MALHIDETFALAPPSDWGVGGAITTSIPPPVVTYQAAQQAVDLAKTVSGHAQWRLQMGCMIGQIGALDFTIEADIEVLASPTLEVHFGFHMRTGNGEEAFQLAHYKPTSSAGYWRADKHINNGSFTGAQAVSNYTYRPCVIGGRYRIKMVRNLAGNKVSIYQDDLLCFDYMGIADTIRLMPCIFLFNTTIRVHSVKFDSDSYSDPVFMAPIPLTAIPANQEPRAQFQPQDITWRGSPGFVYPGPLPTPKQTQFPLLQSRDYYWFRDGVRNAEQGYIENRVTINGEGVARRVLCFLQSGELVGETWSRASDGKYRFDLLWLNQRYMMVAQDDPAFGPADYNAVAADYQLPTPYAPGEGVGLV